MDAPLSVPEIRASFTHQPASYAVTTRPDRDAVRNIRKKLMANLAVHHSDIDDSGGDMRFLVMRPEQWREFHLYLRRTAPTDPAAVADAIASIPIPSIPIVHSPGSLTMVPGWQLADYTLANNLHTIKKRNFTIFTRYNTALLQDIQEAVPAAIIAQICDEDGNIQHRSPSQVLDFLENKYKRMRPQDVAAILTQFNAPYDDTLTIDEYFHRQNRLIRAMNETDEPISSARAIRTCLGHMLTLVHLKRACINWDKETAPTWESFCQHFSSAVQQHEDHQDALADAGLANLAITETELNKRLADQAQHFLAQMAEQQANSNNQIADALSAHLENTSVPSEIIPSGTIAASALETQSMVAALEKQVQQLLASNSRNNSNNNHNTGANRRHGRNNNSNNKRGKRRAPPPPRTERRWANQNYCWTHGCDVDDEHTSATCWHKSPMHQDAATFANKMNGSTTNLNLRT